MGHMGNMGVFAAFHKDTPASSFSERIHRISTWAQFSLLGGLLFLFIVSRMDGAPVFLSPLGRHPWVADDRWIPSYTVLMIPDFSRLKDFHEVVKEDIGNDFF